MGVIKEGDEYVGALAGGNFGLLARQKLAFKDGRRKDSPGIPGVNVGGGLGNCVGFDEGDVVIVTLSHEVSHSSAEAVAQCIVK